jgi:hypothetical protein
MAPRGLALLGIDVDTRAIDHSSPATIADLANYGRRFNIAYPLLFDPAREGVSGYTIQSYPTVYAIDKAGVVRWAASGEVELDVLRQVAEQLLAG